jgi:glycosyltransferase involved in cell wall biosynthesis
VQIKISIITVNLNNKAGLEKTVQSVISQTCRDYELIVIDGGSADGSKDVIRQYEEQISYWVSEKDKGIYHAMNKGISVACGEYCYFLNSGDYLVNENLFQELFKFDIYADIVSGNVLKIRKNGKYQTIRPHDKPTLHKLCIHSLPHQASLIRRDLFNEIGLYNESFRIVSDFDFFLKALVIFQKSYQKVDLNFSYFNLEGISHNPAHYALAKEESYICLKNNFPQLVDDLMDYRYFYISNIGQLIRLIRQKEKLYSFLEKTVGWIFKIKKFIIGK